ncbi:Aste57867_2573 [Aphanomyces stellatus]|uniref:Aste57867_2573 protein n=1 Tax=Aphanomyces stellatus TaxID=120398 RepID=A0A485K9H3_9STRA|nr:hypothetical protein As57867_002566 [Aphanomyces stellatus]VFT79769.1 Aste57867_2573 [Aphanomyces stellatus]
MYLKKALTVSVAALNSRGPKAFRCPRISQLKSYPANESAGIDHPPIKGMSVANRSQSNDLSSTHVLHYPRSFLLVVDALLVVPTTWTSMATTQTTTHRGGLYELLVPQQFQESDFLRSQALRTFWLHIQSVYIRQTNDPLTGENMTIMRTVLSTKLTSSCSVSIAGSRSASPRSASSANMGFTTELKVPSIQSIVEVRAAAIMTIPKEAPLVAPKRLSLGVDLADEKKEALKKLMQKECSTV